ncbi:hypothetical protein [Nostoc sp.]
MILRLLMAERDGQTRCCWKSAIATIKQMGKFDLAQSCTVRFLAL